MHHKEDQVERLDLFLIFLPCCIFSKNSYNSYSFIFFHIQMAQQNTALVLIGLQELWRDKNSEYHLRNMNALIDRACYLIQYAREMGYKIIFIKHHEKE